jgi:hypothetical protein
MIPEQFKQNTILDIEVFGFPVQVNYRFYWPGDNKKIDPAAPDPLVNHMEFHSDTKIISDTGYRSHFFHTDVLEDTAYQSIEELVTEFGKHFARENGYEPLAPAQQLCLF